MSTALVKLRHEDGGHWYTRAGLPCFEVPKKKGGGTTKTTLRHAKELNLLPSPTTILQIASKPALTDWMVDQACAAVLTSPRRDGEQLDEFVRRVLNESKEQDEVRNAAAAAGTRIHDAIARRLQDGTEPDPDIAHCVQAAVVWLQERGIRPVKMEQTVVLDGVCGTCDLAGELEADPGVACVVDWKTKSAAELPDEAYFEHQEQISFYTAATLSAGKQYREARCWVVYISTAVPGKISACDVTNWRAAYRSFRCFFESWCFRNSYDPRRADLSVDQAIDRAFAEASN